MKIRIKRIYEEKSEKDGNRILVDRLWPRGISKKEADLTDWWKEIAPSDDLRKWFNHDPEKWSEFKKKYKKELSDKKSNLENLLNDLDKRQRITLLYGTKEKDHNQAVVLKEFIESMEIES